ncbi:PEP-CTERM sorting domain-containing protein [Botrimarina hoheduenensis]|uniref:PEP-CTERM protein-sorting domain-containing protein n=1 Tax=Botrimarina hoheduenensis TaxID=2528000 RepID=A0A5C5WCF3_9BACT|nr:PEP-CTERM sorting domain-containing protein [Botrimarina hoheduenensis]TWT48588.1 hypothetical protein Pla111_03630 [Botrimarina hoheduenensis]
MTTSRSTFLLATALAVVLSLASDARAQMTTTIVGGSLRNGDFNADTSTIDQRSHDETPEWINIGTSGVQTGVATRTNLGFDGSRNGQITDSPSSIFGLDTGYNIVSGDVYNISYQWRDAFNWSDVFDNVSVSLFTTADNLIGGAKNTLATSLSGASSINNAYESFVQNSLYSAVPSDIGKRLFVELGGLDGNGSTGGFARVDNFMLTEGFIPPPTPGTPAAPSPLTGINLFSDTFNRPDAVDSADSVTTGMSSAVFSPTVGTTYAEFRGSFGTATSDISGNKLLLGVGSGESMVGIDRNFIDQAIIDAGGFAIEAIIDPSTGVNGLADNRFLAIAVGMSQQNATTQTMRIGSEGSNADRQYLEQGAFTFTIEDDGQYNAFDSYAKDKQAAFPGIFVEVNNVGEFENNGQTNHDKASVIDDGQGLGQNDFLAQIGAQIEQDEYKVRLEFEFADFNDGTDVVVTAFIQDIQIDLDPSNGIEANPGDRDTYTFKWDGNNQNYIGFEGRAAPASLDFLMIETLAAPVSGDFNGDGKVDNGDLNLLLGSWGANTVPAAWVNGFSAPVDNAELNALLGNWGFGTAVAVPEPTSVLILLGTLMATSFRRRG